MINNALLPIYLESGSQHCCGCPHLKTTTKPCEVCSNGVNEVYYCEAIPTPDKYILEMKDGKPVRCIHCRVVISQS